MGVNGFEVLHDVFICFLLGQFDIVDDFGELPLYLANQSVLLLPNLPRHAFLELVAPQLILEC